MKNEERKALEVSFDFLNKNLKNSNNKEFKMLHYIANCLNKNIMPDEKNLNLMTKVVKKTLKKVKK